MTAIPFIFYDSGQYCFFFCFGSNLLSFFVCIYLGWQQWLWIIAMVGSLGCAFMFQDIG